MAEELQEARFFLFKFYKGRLKFLNNTKFFYKSNLDFRDVTIICKTIYRKPKLWSITKQRKTWHPLAGGGGGGKVDLDLWPCDPKSIGFLPSSYLHVKFESDWAKTVVYIQPTRSYTQSAEVDLDLWPCVPKSIGFLLSSSTTNMIRHVKFVSDWAKTVVQVSCPQGKTWRTHIHTHSLTQPPTNSNITISPPTLLQADNNTWG